MDLFKKSGHLLEELRIDNQMYCRRWRKEYNGGPEYDQVWKMYKGGRFLSHLFKCCIHLKKLILKDDLFYSCCVQGNQDVTVNKSITDLEIIDAKLTGWLFPL
jgi:hypothetical protein